MAANNKAVIVTGAASGIGLAVTMGLIAEVRAETMDNGGRTVDAAPDGNAGGNIDGLEQ